MSKSCLQVPLALITMRQAKEAFDPEDLMLEDGDHRVVRDINRWASKTHEVSQTCIGVLAPGVVEGSGTNAAAGAETLLPRSIPGRSDNVTPPLIQTRGLPQSHRIPHDTEPSSYFQSRRASNLMHSRTTGHKSIHSGRGK